MVVRKNIKIIIQNQPVHDKGLLLAETGKITDSGIIGYHSTPNHRVDI